MSTGQYSIPGINLPGCYFLPTSTSDVKTWGMAERTCQKLDSRAHSMLFNKTSDFQTMQSMMTMASAQTGVKSMNIWLGGFLDPSTKQWLWYNGMVVNSTGWQSGQPDGQNKTIPENCLGATLGGTDTGWSDFPCNSTFAYICQIDDPNTPCESGMNS
uniref:C-type lectin domain-containing protein n=1 Tax=Romanomermis culicivorax TaxID=13658 RepID=A0A915IN13_ROMCU